MFSLVIVLLVEIITLLIYQIFSNPPAPTAILPEETGESAGEDNYTLVSAEEAAVRYKPTTDEDSPDQGNASSSAGPGSPESGSASDPADNGAADAGSDESADSADSQGKTGVQGLIGLLEPTEIPVPAIMQIPSQQPESQVEIMLARVTGNSPGNIINNGGIAAIQDNWIYYQSNDSGKIYKVKTDGSGRTKINNNNSYFINVVGDWIYYVNKNDNNRIYKIKTDGSNKVKINDDNSWSLNVISDWIYYVNKGNGEKIYKIKIDGSDNQIVD